jgi:hypothetical protein
MNSKNKEIANIFYEMAELLEIKGVAFKPRAYRRAAIALEKFGEDISKLYAEEGKTAFKKIPGVGESISTKIEEYLRKGKIQSYEELKKETAIRTIITYFFKTKGVSLEELKRDAKKRKIIYSRFTRPAKQLLELAGSLEKAKEAIQKVAEWANSRGLDYAIETVFKKWLELDRLKPKEIVKKPYYQGNPMVWSQTHRKWYVIDEYGNWLEFAAREEDIEWRIIK